MLTEYCHYCTNPLPKEPIVAIREVNIVRDGIEMDVEAEYKFCSEECKNDYIEN